MPLIRKSKLICITTKEITVLFSDFNLYMRKKTYATLDFILKQNSIFALVVETVIDSHSLLLCFKLERFPVNQNKAEFQQSVWIYVYGSFIHSLKSKEAKIDLATDDELKD